MNDFLFYLSYIIRKRVIKKIFWNWNCSWCYWLLAYVILRGGAMYSNSIPYFSSYSDWALRYFIIEHASFCFCVTLQTVCLELHLIFSFFFVISGCDDDRDRWGHFKNSCSLDRLIECCLFHCRSHQIPLYCFLYN